MRVKQSFVTNSSSCGHIVILRKNYDFDEIYKLAEEEIAEYLGYNLESDDARDDSLEDHKKETKELLEDLKKHGNIEENTSHGYAVTDRTAIDIVNMVIAYGAGHHIQSFDVGPDSTMIINIDEFGMEYATKAIGEYLYEFG